ncbi:serine/threonine-protein kinase BLUS1 isoform X3 [Aegilops tauschii subsp. strangulata]|uniref:serine/threonine-protein kinase BLUS1 isoform X3 n=1 Tax=Aegilops tauschii subsp. strangulata TaxID=200361 RepID=UPI00098A4745|nr:serine/threonine-protein kinase OSR1 isoform X3 [Aegilops tauschii subsp. strangulata]
MVGSGSKHAAGGSGGGGGGERRKYPIRAEDYELYEEIGQGVSAIVYRALCRPLGETVAVKVLDFERTNSNLNNIMREAQTMILIDHPNVVKAICSFANNQTLWVVMPYMAGGSCLHIMKSVYPDGFEEAVIATLLREVLRGLEYLHHHGHIHRDVKAGNILVDSRGGVKLGDFGVSACLFESGDRQRARNTFVGTPCWMAPEVMEQLHGYDFKADIWSFGITALELAHGHAPFSKYPPMKVLLMTLQNAPPGLDYERDKKFSRHFKQMVAMCLVKEPSKRPTATKLLKQSFFKQARSHDYIVRKLLEGLPGLGARYQALKEKDEHLLAQKKMPDGRKEEISQDEYKRGISSWNFDIDDLKSQASLISECEDTISSKDTDISSIYDFDTSLQEQALEGSLFSMKYDTDIENDVMANDKSAVSSPEQSVCLSRASLCGTSNGVLVNGHVRKHSSMESSDLDLQEKDLDAIPTSSFQERKCSFSSCSSDGFLSSKESSKPQINIHNRDKGSGGVLQVADEPSPEAISRAHKSLISNVDEHDDRSKPPLIQQRGRFKVTPGNVELDKAHSPGLQKSHSMQLEAAQEKEKELVNEVLELQWRLLCAQDEVQRLKAKAAQI